MKWSGSVRHGRRGAMFFEFPKSNVVVLCLLLQPTAEPPGTIRRTRLERQGSEPWRMGKWGGFGWFLRSKETQKEGVDCHKQAALFCLLGIRGRSLWSLSDWFHARCFFLPQETYLCLGSLRDNEPWPEAVFGFLKEFWGLHQLHWSSTVT